MPAQSAGGIREVHLLSLPMAVNLDASPEADAIAVTIYVNDARTPKPVPIERGTLEVLMFDGILDREAGSSLPPLRTWKFEARELRPFAITTSIGPGYRFVLNWEDAKPKQDRVTVIARYQQDSEGRVIHSHPNSISVVAK